MVTTSMILVVVVVVLMLVAVDIGGDDADDINEWHGGNTDRPNYSYRVQGKLVLQAMFRKKVYFIKSGLGGSK